MGMKTSISELALMTETEKLYRINERLEEFHLSMGDFKAAMKDKWYLAQWGQKGGN